MPRRGSIDGSMCGVRNLLARLLLVLATLAGTLAFTAYLLLATTLNPHRAGDVAAAFLDDPAGRTAVTNAVAGAIEQSTGRQVSTTQRQTLSRLLGRPEVHRALRRTALTPNGELDYSPALREVARRLRGAGQPALAAAATKAAAGHRITIPGALFDRYKQARDLAHEVLRDAAIAAGVLAAAALIIASSKRWAIRRIGFAILGVVIGTVILYLVLPRVAASIIGDNVGTALLTAFGTDLVRPLAIFAAVGIAVIMVSFVPVGGRSRRY